MEVEGFKKNNVAVVTVKGRMDAVTAPDFEKQCAKWIEENEKVLILDFKGLEYISSAGLRSILATGKKIKGQGGKLLFCNMNGMVKGVFDISGFASIFPIFETLEQALDNA
jgi:anti-anti-sigma factor